MTYSEFVFCEDQVYASSTEIENIVKIEGNAKSNHSAHMPSVHVFCLRVIAPVREVKHLN